jgi:hypothetical protein
VGPTEGRGRSKSRSRAAAAQQAPPPRVPRPHLELQQQARQVGALHLGRARGRQQRREVVLGAQPEAVAWAHAARAAGALRCGRLARGGERGARRFELSALALTPASEPSRKGSRPGGAATVVCQPASTPRRLGRRPPTLDVGATSSDSRPMAGLKARCLTKQLSTTYTMPSRVRLVSGGCRGGCDGGGGGSGGGRECWRAAPRSGAQGLRRRGAPRGSQPAPPRPPVPAMLVATTTLRVPRAAGWNAARCCGPGRPGAEAAGAATRWVSRQRPAPAVRDQSQAQGYCSQKAARAPPHPAHPSTAAAAAGGT